MIQYGKEGETHGVGLGGTYRFGDVKVKYTLAFHSSSFEDEENRIFHYAGILIMEEGKTIDLAGDTASFPI